MIKKNFDELAYMPEKKGQKERVVVGLSGGIHSFIAAYLLKIQKYELIGVTIMGLSEGTLASNLNCQITQDDIKRIQDFCNNLGISHVVVSAQDIFADEVLDHWVARKLSGKFSSPCWQCHHFRMDQLFKKALDLEAAFVATGHFAKVFKNESHHSVYVHTGNDEAHDSSDLLARLPHDLLTKIMLPLSDLQTKEVFKLAENFGINKTEQRVDRFQCLNDLNKTKEFIETHSPKRYLGVGEAYNSLESKVLDHEGVYHFNYAQPIIRSETKSSGEELLAKYTMRDKRIITKPKEYFIRKYFMLDQCVISEETSRLFPIQCVARFSSGEYVDCWLQIKVMNHAYVELDKAIFIPEGSVVSIQRKKGKNAKVLITGRVIYLAEDTGNEDKDEKDKIDYGIDF